MGLSKGLDGYNYTYNVVNNYPYGVGSGGTSSNITVGGLPYRMLTFTGSGTFTVTTAGMFDCTIIGGGAAGKSQNGNGGGGGGAGALVTSQFVYFEVGTHTVGIGAGGLVYPPIAVTPSFVGKHASGKPQGPGDGGTGNQAGAAALVAGFAGGNGYTAAGPNNNSNGGGGGGGMGGVGAEASLNRGYGNLVNGGAGGAGIDWSAWRGEAAGTTRYGAGGGGGGGYASTISAPGGAGGGGNGALYYSSVGTNAAANTGSGGGGGSEGGAYTQGGSGIVLIRFKL